LNTFDKLTVLGGAARYDVCASSFSCRQAPSRAGRMGNPASSGICHSFLPDGRCISLFRVLMTNACEQDCSYCVNRRSRNTQRTSFLPEELASLFIEFYVRNYVEGLFLSSGVCGRADTTMEKMVKTVELLREKYGYQGYVHLKVLPGASQSLVEKAGELADRMSVNLEAPNRKRLAVLSPGKEMMTNMLERMQWMHQLSEQGKIPSGQTTQFVVGPAGETDFELLRSVTWLYKHVGLRRAYFSAFIPVPETPLENFERTPLLREHRLYQAEFLLRTYGFSLEELAFKGTDFNLPLDYDPKMVFALARPGRYPVEVNQAAKEELLRIPGIGKRSAARILSLRRQGRITDIQELKNLGVVVKRAKPFITILGKAQGHLETLLQGTQLNLWSPSRDHPLPGGPEVLPQGRPALPAESSRDSLGERALPVAV
jgi:putative DNA modification/repair radical SAM protein